MLPFKVDVNIIRIPLRKKDNGANSFPVVMLVRKLLAEIPKPRIQSLAVGGPGALTVDLSSNLREML